MLGVWFKGVLVDLRLKYKIVWMGLSDRTDRPGCMVLQQGLIRSWG